MKKLLSYIILLSMLSFNSVAHAQSAEPVDYGFVVLDVLLYRPVGFVTTLVGGAAFLGLSPLTAFASIPAPHDAFKKTFTALVAAPAVYTFVRPVGDPRLIINQPQPNTLHSTNQPNAHYPESAVPPKTHLPSASETRDYQRKPIR